MKKILKSHKLEQVRYDIRGTIHKEAIALEEDGHKLIKLNIGNPAPFDFEAPDEVVVDILKNLPKAQGYGDSKGLYSARKAIVQYYQLKGFKDIDVNDVYIGNGVSELITMTMQALLNNDDEILIPSPDYPLWTAAATLAGGKAIHYLCDEQQNWAPDLTDIRSKITAKTKAIVIINPNNPTGAVYTKEHLLEVAQIAREHSLMIFADEIYEKILFDDAVHYHIGQLAPDVFTITFNGLSKAYRVAGFRQGWMMLSGNKERAKDYIEGLDMLSSMRLCANMPMQHGIQTALGGYQSINELILPGGRLLEQRNLTYKMINSIEGLSCVKPMGAMYAFVRVDSDVYDIESEQQFVLDFLRQEHVLVVQGCGFNYTSKDPHFRVVMLAHDYQLEKAFKRLEKFLQQYKREK